MSELFNQIKKQVLKLEVHKYSPEQNTLHFLNGKTLRTGWSLKYGYNFTIDNAIEIMILTYSNKTIQNLIK